MSSVHYIAGAQERIFRKAIDSLDIAGSIDDYIFGDPKPSGSSVDANTVIYLTPRPSSNIKGTVGLYYDRIDMDTVHREVIPSVHHRRISEILDIINRNSDFDIGLPDVENSHIPPTREGHGEASRVGWLIATPNSYFYTGKTKLNYAHPKIADGRDDVLLISTSIECDTPRDMGRLYGSNGNVVDWYFFLGNMTGYREAVMDGVFNAHGGLTYIRGYFDLDYHLHGEEITGARGETLVVDHYGMIVNVMGLVPQDCGTNKALYSSNKVYYSDGGAIYRLDSSMVKDESWVISDAGVEGRSVESIAANEDGDIVYSGHSDDTSRSAYIEKSPGYRDRWSKKITLFGDNDDPIKSRVVRIRSVDGLTVACIVPVSCIEKITVIDIESIDGRVERIVASESQCFSPFIALDEHGDLCELFKHKHQGVSQKRLCSGIIDFFISGTSINLIKKGVDHFTGKESILMDRYSSTGSLVRDVPVDIPEISPLSEVAGNKSIVAISGMASFYPDKERSEIVPALSIISNKTLNVKTISHVLGISPMISIQKY